MPRWTVHFVLLLMVLGVSGCGNSLVNSWRAPPVIQVERLTIPADMLTCIKAPAVPGDNADQAAFGSWALEEKAAELDCRGKLAAIEHLQAVDSVPVAK